MRLTAKPIINWCDVNMFTFGNQWTVRSGDPLTLYFQIIDADQGILNNSTNAGFFSSAFSGLTGVTGSQTTAGLRYLLGVGTANQPYGIQVTFPSIDMTAQVTLIATQADPNDSSIWKVQVPASVQIGGGNVQFTLFEGSSVRRFSVLNMLGVEFPNGNGSC